MNVVSVGDVSEQVRGVSYSKGESSEERRPGFVAILRANNITEEGLTFDDLVYVPSARVSNKQRIHKNDVVIAASSGSLSVVGKAAQARQEVDGSFGAFCKVLRPNAKVDPLYFGHFFRTPTYRRIVSGLAAGANINNLRNEHLDDLRFPLPPLPEQKRIAAILDAADALRAKRRESIEQLDSLVQATFLEMFGDPVTNPKGWPKEPISQVGRVITGNTPSRQRRDYYGTDIEWIKSDNISDGSFVLTRSSEGLSATGKQVGRIAPKGSILVTCIAGSASCIGNAGIADRDVAFNQQINAFVPGSRIDLWFAFVQLLVGKRLVQMAATNAMTKMVSKSVFSSIPILLPPLALQARFASIVESIEQQKARMKAHLAELDTLFASLQSRAFNGELVA